MHKRGDLVGTPVGTGEVVAIAVNPEGQGWDYMVSGDSFLDTFWLDEVRPVHNQNLWR